MAIATAVEVGVSSTGVEVEVELTVGEIDGRGRLAEGVVDGWFVPEHPFIKMKTGIQNQKIFCVKTEFILSSQVVP